MFKSQCYAFIELALAVLLLLAIGSGCAGAPDRARADPTTPSQEVFISPGPTATPQIIINIVELPVSPPPPTPTPHPQLNLTPYPKIIPAKDARGTLFYQTMTYEDPQSKYPRKCAVYALPVDQNGQPAGEPKVVAEYENCGEIIPSPDGRYLALMQGVDMGFRPLMLDIEAQKVWDVFDPNSQIQGLFESWHPDSQRILYSSDMTRDAGLWLVDIHTGEYSVLAGLKSVPNGGAAMSPDGTQVIYNDADETWLLSLDGQKREQVNWPIGFLWGWSPDERYIAYAANGGVGVTDMTARTHSQLDPEHLTITKTIESPQQTRILEIAWSPDSQVVAASEQIVREKTDASVTDPLKTGNILLFAASGPQQRTLLASGGQHPAWSPDGSMVAFLSSRSGATEIWIVNADGSNLRQVTFAGADRELLPWGAPVWISTR